MKYIEIHLYTDVIWNEQEQIWTYLKNMLIHVEIKVVKMINFKQFFSCRKLCWLKTYAKENHEALQETDVKILNQSRKIVQTCVGNWWF